MDESHVAIDRKNHEPVNGHVKTPSVEIKTDGSARLVLIRGLPGSGKTTMASVLSLLGYKHFEADMFFVGDDGVYRHDSTRLKSAHAWCQTNVRNALKEGSRVVVSNTFTQHWEMQPYFDMGVSIQILEAGGNWCNRHGVPDEKLKSMRDRWVSLPPAYACARWNAPNKGAKAHTRALNPSESAPPVSSEGQIPSIDATEPHILRIFKGGFAEPELASRSEIPDSSIVHMVKWYASAVKVDMKGFAGFSTQAHIPKHREFHATMHVRGSCMMVDVAHKDHGIFFGFVIAPETSGVSQEMWTQFGGEGPQPSGRWCLEVLMPSIKEVFPRAQKAPLWLVNFERTLAWMWFMCTWTPEEP